jgi:hypothetical protein
MKGKREDDDYVMYLTREPLCVLKKKRSPDHIALYEDLKDSWFIYVMTMRKTTIKEVSMIIRKDVPGWLTYLKTMGWEPTEPFNFIIDEN